MLTTHDLGDIEAVCERVVLIDLGRVLFDGTASALKASLGGQRRLVVELAQPMAVHAVSGLGEGLPAEASAVDAADGQTVRLALSFSRDDISAARLIEAVLGRAEVVDLAIEEPQIEQVVAQFYEQRQGAAR